MTDAVNYSISELNWGVLSIYSCCWILSQFETRTFQSNTLGLYCSLVVTAPKSDKLHAVNQHII